MKLYRVTLQGMTYSSSGPVYGVSYVVAENADKAYEAVKEFLDKENLGFSKDRRLAKVELIADTKQYGESDYMLFT